MERCQSGALPDQAEKACHGLTQ